MILLDHGAAACTCAAAATAFACSIRPILLMLAYRMTLKNSSKRSRVALFRAFANGLKDSEPRDRKVRKALAERDGR